ncbi:hypothetical protein AAHE18_10G201200 [Arachis hypogaea]
MTEKSLSSSVCPPKSCNVIAFFFWATFVLTLQLHNPCEKENIDQIFLSSKEIKLSNKWWVTGCG